MQTLTECLSNFIQKCSFSDFPKAVVTQAKENILDSIGCALGGVSFPEVKGITQELKKVDTQVDCPVWGTPVKASLLTATLLNGVLCHCVEMDDVHKTSKTHTGAVVVPAAVTFAGYKGYCGQDLVTAVILGYEVAFRVGAGINAAAHRLQGWHATGTCTPFGAAAAISKLLGASSQQTMYALGMAGTQSSGLWALTMDGANCKKLFMGRAAQSGVLSALLAQGGMTGPAYILEAQDGGLFKASSSNYSFDAVVQALGSRWDILKTDRKPYACCRSAQPPIDAILAMKQKYGVKAEDVQSIRVNTYEIAVKQCFNTKQPKNVVEAQLCIPYTVAVAMIDGAASARQFTTERLQDGALMALAQKVDVYADEAFSSRYPQSWGCELVLTTKDGQTYSETILNAKGDSGNPLSMDEIAMKFRSLAQGVLTESAQNEVIDMVMHLDELDNVKQLTAALQV